MNPTTTTCAPLVFGRTYDVDFRFIAVPAGFDFRWAEPYILATMSIPERLAGAPRWSMFQNQQFRVAGVTSTAQDLIGPADPHLRDASGRMVYAFVGYVWKVTPYPDPLPPYGTDLTVFAELYRYLHDQWNATTAPRPAQENYTPLTYPLARDSATGADINLRDKRVKVFPDDPHTRANLWAAVRTIGSSTSLWLGATRELDIVESKFLNATLTSASRQYEIDLDQKPAVPAAPPAPAKSAPSMVSTGAVTTASMVTSGPPSSVVARLRARYDDAWLRAFASALERRQYLVRGDLAALTTGGSVYAESSVRELIAYNSMNDQRLIVMVKTVQDLVALVARADAIPPTEIDVTSLTGEQAADALAQRLETAAIQRLQYQAAIRQQTNKEQSRGRPTIDVQPRESYAGEQVVGYISNFDPQSLVAIRVESGKYQQWLSNVWTSQVGEATIPLPLYERGKYTLIVEGLYQQHMRTEKCEFRVR